MQSHIDKKIFNAREALKKGDFTRTASILKRVNDKQDSQTADTLRLEAQCVYQLKRYPRVIQLLKRLEQVDAGVYVTYQIQALLGRSYLLTGNRPLAIRHLQASADKNSSPDNAETLQLLSKLYARINDRQRLESVARRLLKWRGYAERAHRQLIHSAQKLQNRELLVSDTLGFAQEFLRLSERDLFFVIKTLINAGALPDALKLIDRVVRARGNPVWLEPLRAEMAMEEGDYRKVSALLDNKMIDTLPSWVYLPTVLQLKGSALEKQGLYDEAFRCFSDMAKLTRPKPGKVYRDFVKDYQKLTLTKLWTITKKSKPSPIFMVGFPRSGTTLLDTILHRHPDTCLLSETDSLAMVIDAFSMSLGKTYPKDLVRLSEKELEQLRRVYFEYIATIVSPDEGTLLIDKLPMGSLHLPLILTLFPDAKIIFSLRHPMDVCLSNFQQDYVLNDEMVHLISLEDCVARYRGVMTLVGEYEDALKPSIHYLRYEDLVADTEDSIKGVLEFIDLPYSAELLKQTNKGNGRYIKTPSRRQVAKAVNSASVAKWKHYKEYILPYKEALQPFISKYGYSLE